MTRLHGMPPGRAGRLWLRHRLGVAGHGAVLLDRKLRILHTRLDECRQRAERTAQQWESACRGADVWLLRGELLGGQRAVRLASTGRPADVEVIWEWLMGVRVPEEVNFMIGDRAETLPPPGNTAIVLATNAYRDAVAAAVRHAAADAALRVVQAEELSTRRRLRAITERWIPLLEGALSDLELALEEQDRTEAVGLRWAAGTLHT
ncbi:V-type ATP synthase subunit D [Rhodococcus sp. IEGM 1379]|uniref:V-type ATP synthase subunit D n=1 Tax=Rhodococcus sp. IEGM 1379 TaxID=3047086 RepID=UPI0024B79929|nr:V-type ATP synthase subunit D [Rhodococcus sp. IEGM 1379]MDI9914446.1 V-type ATP synthase subunit D [Rhodococcus sp. IEGM 1379]